MTNEGKEKMMTATTPVCPLCGAPTHERRSTRANVKRWFPCTRYPDCKGAVREFTRELTALEDKWANATPKAQPLRLAEKPFTASKYQEAIFDFIKTGTGHGVVEAVAG